VRAVISSVALVSLAMSNISIAEVTAWQAWENELHRKCPSNHVEWVADGGYDDLLAAFEITLPVHTQNRITTIADYARRCVKETGGFSCEMGTHLDAYRRLGLLKIFVAFDCSYVKCEEVALCSRFPGRVPL
jgi:hypothetical protein